MYSMWRTSQNLFLVILLLHKYGNRALLYIKHILKCLSVGYHPFIEFGLADIYVEKR